MAAKDADLARDFSLDFVFINNDAVAALTLELTATPPESAGTRFEELFLVGVTSAALEIELTTTPHAVQPPPGDVSPPEIANFLPAPGTGITSTQIISFDITDETGLAAVVIMVSFDDGIVEVVHDNDGFRGKYVGGVNTRTAIAGGWHFTVRRIGGWQLSPSFQWVPIDTSGNIGVIP